MRKFLTMAALMLMCTMFFASCSSSDDDGGGYTAEQIIGDWQVVHAEGVADFEYNGEQIFEKSFDVTFDHISSEDGEYMMLYSYFVERITFTEDGKFIQYQPMFDGTMNKLEWGLEDGYGTYIINGNKLIVTTYYDNKIDAITNVTIKELTDTKLVVHFSAKDLYNKTEEPNDYVWYDVTYQRIPSHNYGGNK